MKWNLKYVIIIVQLVEICIYTLMLIRRKLMKKIISTLKSISRSRNIHEMINRTPESYIEFIIFFPVLLMLILPLYQLIYTSVFPPAPFF